MTTGKQCQLLQSFFIAEKMASEIAHGSSIKKKSTKRKSFHANMHFPQGRDVSEDLIRAVHDDPDAAEIEDDDIKAMTMNLSQKRRLK